MSDHVENRFSFFSTVFIVEQNRSAPQYEPVFRRVSTWPTVVAAAGSNERTNGKRRVNTYSSKIVLLYAAADRRVRQESGRIGYVICAPGPLINSVSFTFCQPFVVLTDAKTCTRNVKYKFHTYRHVVARITIKIITPISVFRFARRMYGNVGVSLSTSTARMYTDFGRYFFVFVFTSSVSSPAYCKRKSYTKS